MELKEGYKVLYEAVDYTDDTAERKGYATKNLPWDDTAVEVIVSASNRTVKLTDYKLVYEKDEMLFGSKTGIPAENDAVLTVVDRNGNVIFGKAVTPPAPKTYTVSVDETVSKPYISVEGTGTYEANAIVDVTFTIEYPHNYQIKCKTKIGKDYQIASGYSTTVEPYTISGRLTMPSTDVLVYLEER